MNNQFSVLLLVFLLFPWQMTFANSANDSRIINLSVSDVVKPDLNMGFIAKGNGKVMVLLRAWNLEFAGIPSVDPKLIVEKNGQFFASNDSWQSPTGKCQPILPSKQQPQFADPRNAACYLELEPDVGYVIKLERQSNSNIGSESASEEGFSSGGYPNPNAQAQLSADVDGGGQCEHDVFD